MAVSGTLSTQQGIAYIVAAHGVLQRQARRTGCPAALLHTLLALEALNSREYALSARTSELQQAMRIRLPLLRGYVRDLEQSGYVVRERVFLRGPRLLRLTSTGRGLLSGLAGSLREAAEQVLG